MIALTVTVIMIIIYYSCIVIINYCFVLLFQDPHVAFFTNSKPKFFPWNASSGLKQMGGRVCVKSVTAGFSLSSRNVPERSDLLCLHISLDIPYEPGHSVRSLSFCLRGPAMFPSLRCPFRPRRSSGEENNIVWILDLENKSKLYSFVLEWSNTL